MSVASVLKQTAHNFGQLSGAQKALRIGGTAVGATAVGLGLAACTPTPPKDAKTMAVDEFGEYDANGDDGVGTDETSIHWETQPYSKETSSYRVGDFVFRTIETRQDNYDTSVDKLVRATKGNDAVASWKEIGDFALNRFDQDKDNMLDGGEVKDFIKEYGAETENFRREVLSSYTDTVYSPINRDNGNDGWDNGSGWDNGGGWDNGSDGGSDPGTGPGTTPVDPNGDFDPDYGGGNGGYDDGFGGSDEGN